VFIAPFLNVGFACMLFLLLKTFFSASVKSLLSDLSEVCFSPCSCSSFQPQQVVQKKPAQVRKAILNSLNYFQRNNSTVFKFVSFTAKNEGKYISHMSWGTAVGLLGTATRTIHAVALGNERRKQ